MLTYGQLKLNFIFYNICYKLCLLPLKLENLTFCSTNGPRYYVWKLQFLLSSGYGIFMAVRLLQLLLVDSAAINLIYFSVHAAMSLMGTLTCLYYELLITNKSDHLLLCNELLLEVNRPARQQKGFYRQLGKDLLCLWKFSGPEIMLLVIPIVMSIAPTLIVPAIYLFQHESPQFLYSLCPPEYRSMRALVLYGTAEVWLISNWFSLCYHFAFVTATLLQKSIQICDKETRRMRQTWLIDVTTLKGKKAVRRYRECLLQTQLYNSMISGIVYMTKLLFLAMAILGFFITIRFGTELPILMTGINLVMGILGAFLYNFLYDAAVWMPIKFDELKRCLYFCSTNYTREDRFVFHKELKSLPAVMLKIGSFDTFRRTTTPEFVDFVVQQICSLLLTFR